ncbi:MAG: DUF2999 family protein [Oligoflexales bacterium]
MQELIELLKTVNISQEQLMTLQEKIKSNPLGAMQYLSELNLPPDFFTKLMQIVMTKPDALQSLMDGIGMTADVQKNVQEHFEKIPKN